MENLEIPMRDNLGFTPEIVGYLASIKEFEYSYKYYCLRHPGGIFNVSTNHVLKDFIELLKELEEHQDSYDEHKKIGLENKFRQLINDFFKFNDSCFEIIQACCRQHKRPSEKEFLWKWLEKNNYTTGNDFFKKLNPDLDYYRRIHNKLKHSSNTIQPTFFHKNGISIMGYHLQSVADDGSIEPDEDIHPKHQNMYSASSYNFNIRKLYYLVYKISYVLQAVITEHFKKTYNVELSFNKDHKADDRLWKELQERITRLPRFYFPNEFNQSVPEAKINDKTLTFKIKKAETANLNGYKVEYSELGDGFSRTFRLPFLRPRI